MVRHILPSPFPSIFILPGGSVVNWQADTLRCLLSVVLGRTDGLSAEVKPWGWQANRASGGSELSGGEDPKLVSRLVILFMSLHASSYHELESKVHQQVRHRSS